MFEKMANDLREYVKQAQLSRQFQGALKYFNNQGGSMALGGNAFNRIKNNPNALAALNARVQNLQPMAGGSEYRQLMNTNLRNMQYTANGALPAFSPAAFNIA